MQDNRQHVDINLDFLGVFLLHGEHMQLSILPQ